MDAVERRTALRIFFAVLSPQDWAGAFEVVHAFWTRGWADLSAGLLGVLYIAFGVVRASQPVASALILTYILALLLLLISGFVRILLGISRHWRQTGWIMLLLSRIFGVLAGLVILTDFR